MPGTWAHATSSNNNKSDRCTSEWDQWKAAFLGLLAILWEKKLDVLMQTPVRTVLPTAKLNTPGTTVEELRTDQPLLDGGQGKIEEGNGEPQTNVTDLESAQHKQNMVAGGNEVISEPIAAIALPISTPLVASKNCNSNDMEHVTQQEGLEILGVKYESPPAPANALCRQTTKLSMGCTYAPETDPDGNIMASYINCTNAITGMDRLKPLFLTDLGKEATGSLRIKLWQQNKRL
jgi:hypothetical protein